jgi:hypothetical protein
VAGDDRSCLGGRPAPGPSTIIFCRANWALLVVVSVLIIPIVLVHYSWFDTLNNVLGYIETPEARQHGLRLEVVMHLMAKHGSALLPRQWVVKRIFTWSRPLPLPGQRL